MYISGTLSHIVRLITVSLSLTHISSVIYKRNAHCTPTNIPYMCTHTCAHRIPIQAQWPKQVCEQLQMKAQSSSGDLKRKERDLFFSFFTQTRNAQASAAAWVNKRTGLTSLSLGPGACARQHSLCCCQRGCWGLKNYTLQLKGCLCWSAKAFLSILQPTACHVLGGRPPS